MAPSIVPVHALHSDIIVMTKQRLSQFQGELILRAEKRHPFVRGFAGFSPTSSNASGDESAELVDLPHIPRSRLDGLPMPPECRSARSHRRQIAADNLAALPAHQQSNRHN